MTESELSVGIHQLIKNHSGPYLNLTVDIINFLKTKEVFIHNGEIHDVIEVDLKNHDSNEWWSYEVFVDVKDWE